MDKIKIIVIDDHPMVLEGMRAMLTQISFIDLQDTVQHVGDAVERITKWQPDIVITDINMPGISGIELTALIRKFFPKIKVIAMSTFNERSYISQMIQQGANGYLMKSASREEIEQAILTVYEGKMYLSVDLNLSLTDQKEIKDVPVLSSREKEVLLLIADGFSNPQIAEKLFISLHTVDSHRKNLLTKFNVNNTASLIKLAAKNGIL